ncbi:hypothetical protein CO614_04400 [Lysobacteraceae bacterium NML120232]|nr:hypothetical protein CO608_03755 [Xanthomonadaceae bacterium NML08-0793]PJK12523.1 hypothetical protein CO614_04400 [Xanthomonadaceae bacterium NML120232]
MTACAGVSKLRVHGHYLSQHALEEHRSHRRAGYQQNGQDQTQAALLHGQGVESFTCSAAQRGMHHQYVLCKQHGTYLQYQLAGYAYHESLHRQREYCTYPVVQPLGE